ncbi:MAG: sulfatase [Phycisphaeraceae bacterium]
MPNHQPNILLITSEDNGPELSCYGETNVQTPHLDALAASGARFENACVTQAVCSPGRASILTGLYPHQNGQIGLATHKFTMFDGITTLPALLKDAGYRTGRIGKLHVLPESASPFDWVWNPREYMSFQHRDVATTAATASEFMRADDAPFFLMVNYSDAHLPWIDQDCGLPETPLTADDVQVPPAVGVDSPRLRARTASYFNCISRLDTGIGMLLDELERTGQADNTLVIYITDHGPQFSRGKGCCYELALRAPLLVRWPGVASPGTVRDEFVSQIDVLPTVLDAARITLPADLPGRSLKPLVANETVTDWRAHLFAEWNTSHPYPEPAFLNPQRSVRDARYKLILNLLPDRENPVADYYTQHTLVDTGATREEIDAAPPHVRDAYARWHHPPAVELYDLETDPHEFHNLADDPAHAPVRERLLAALHQWQTETADPLADPDKLARFVDEHKRAAQLGGGHRQPDFRWEYVDYLAPSASASR